MHHKGRTELFKRPDPFIVLHENFAFLALGLLLWETNLPGEGKLPTSDCRRCSPTNDSYDTPSPNPHFLSVITPPWKLLSCDQGRSPPRPSACVQKYFLVCRWYGNSTYSWNVVKSLFIAVDLDERFPNELRTSCCQVIMMTTSDLIKRDIYCKQEQVLFPLKVRLKVKTQ